MASHAESNLLPDNPRMPEAVAAGLHQKALTVTVAGAVLLAVGFFTDTTPPKGWPSDAPYHHNQWFFTYLHTFCFALSISLGALFWTLAHHVADAGWSVGIRRIHENVTRTIPWLFLFSLPILFGMSVIYKGSTATQEEISMSSKRFWLSPYFFGARIVFYFCIWMLYSRMMRNWSYEQDNSGSVAITKKAQWWAPSGLVCLGLTATFAAFDLIMSLNYTWFSTIFGVYFWAGCFRSSLAFCILTVLFLRSSGYLKNTITREHLHDMGKLTFGLTVFWTYIAFDQYFLQWYGNVKEETQFFIHRRYDANNNPTTWYIMSVLLPLCYFVVPFLTLLPRGNKRNPKVLAFVACWILFFHSYDQYWQIMPESLKVSVHDNPVSGVQFTWMTIAGWMFFGGLVVTNLCRGWMSAPMIPVGDPRLQESIHFENDEFGDPE